MPIHEVGYRSWDGKKTSQLSRWWVICETGIKLATKSRWVKRMLFVAWLPVMYWGVGFFILEKAIDPDSKSMYSLVESDENAPVDSVEDLKQKVEDGGQVAGRKAIRRALREWFRVFPYAEDLADSLGSGDPDVIRNDIWRWLLMVFFRYPQSLLILFLIGTIAPGLISRDLRSRAFLLYFSRPIGKLEYLLGKLCIPAAFIIGVSTLPALALYFFAIMMSPSLSVFWCTWDVPLRILGATVALVLPTSAIALMLSSLTQESRFANFSWFAVWAMGHGAWLAILLATSMGMGRPPFDPEVMSSTQVQNWSVLSLYNCLGDAQEFIFGFESFEDVWRGTLVLVCITVFSLWILYRRISAPVSV